MADENLLQIMLWQRLSARRWTYPREPAFTRLKADKPRIKSVHAEEISAYQTARIEGDGRTRHELRTRNVPHAPGSAARTPGRVDLEEALLRIFDYAHWFPFADYSTAALTRGRSPLQRFSRELVPKWDSKE